MGPKAGAGKEPKGREEAELGDRGDACENSEEVDSEGDKREGVLSGELRDEVEA